MKKRKKSIIEDMPCSFSCKFSKVGDDGDYNRIFSNIIEIIETLSCQEIEKFDVNDKNTFAISMTKIMSNTFNITNMKSLTNSKLKKSIIEDKENTSTGITYSTTSTDSYTKKTIFKFKFVDSNDSISIKIFIISLMI